MQIILGPGLEPGAAEVFLEFICYSGGPLPEELLPQVKVSLQTPVVEEMGITSECKFEMPKSHNDIVCLIFIFSVPGSDSMG